jgi:hypothetical protein
MTMRSGSTTAPLFDRNGSLYGLTWLRHEDSRLIYLLWEGNGPFNTIPSTESIVLESAYNAAKTLLPKVMSVLSLAPPLTTSIHIKKIVFKSGAINH